MMDMMIVIWMVSVLALSAVGVAGGQCKGQCLSCGAPTRWSLGMARSIMTSGGLMGLVCGVGLYGTCAWAAVRACLVLVGVVCLAYALSGGLSGCCASVAVCCLCVLSVGRAGLKVVVYSSHQFNRYTGNLYFGIPIKNLSYVVICKFVI